MRWLSRHPFPVRAFFEKSLVLGFAVPRSQLEGLIPECLELDLFEEELGFVAVAMVKTKSLRPKWLPKMFGRDFILIGYRIFVRYRGSDGRSLRGLYILGSETDQPSMRRLGSVFTQYRYTISPIEWSSDEGEDTVVSGDEFRVVAATQGDSHPLPEGSPFADWRQARRFAGPMPFTFSYDAVTRDVIIVEGQRESWTPASVSVKEWKIPFLDAMKLDGLVLANAFVVEQVPYEWKRGRVERWEG